MSYICIGYPMVFPVRFCPNSITFHCSGHCHHPSIHVPDCSHQLTVVARGTYAGWNDARCHGTQTRASKWRGSRCNKRSWNNDDGSVLAVPKVDRCVLTYFSFTMLLNGEFFNIYHIHILLKLSWIWHLLRFLLKNLNNLKLKFRPCYFTIDWLY